MLRKGKRAARGGNASAPSPAARRGGSSSGVRRIREDAPRRRLARVLTALGWLVSARRAVVRVRVVGVRAFGATVYGGRGA